eukprot:91554_1
MSFTRYAPVAVPVIVALICLIIMLSNHDSHQIYQKPNGLDYQNDDLVNEVYDFLRASRYDDSINYEDEDFDSKRDVLSDNTPTKYNSDDNPRNIGFADPNGFKSVIQAFDEPSPIHIVPSPPSVTTEYKHNPMPYTDSEDSASDEPSPNHVAHLPPPYHVAHLPPPYHVAHLPPPYHVAHLTQSTDSEDSDSDEPSTNSVPPMPYLYPAPPMSSVNTEDEANLPFYPDPSMPFAESSDSDHESTGWACKTCTYINSPLLNSCEMCYTPKNHIQNDSPFMAAADPIVDEIVDQIFDDPNPDINVDQIHDNHDRHHHSTEDNEEKHVSDQESDEKVCAICFDDLSPESRKTVTGECNHNHIFHTDCMDTWIKRKNICPLCRAEWKPKVFVSDNLEAVLIKWFNKLNFAPKRASNMARGFIEGLKANTDLDDKDNFVEDLNGSPDDSELVEMLSKLIIDTGNFDQSVIKNYVFNLLNSCLDDMYPQWQFQDNNGNWRDFYGVAGERAELAYSQRDVKAQPATVDVACRNCAWRGYSFDFENMIETSLANRDNWFRIRRTH